MAKLNRLDAAALAALKEVYHKGGHDIEVCKALKLKYKEFTKLYDNDADFAELIDLGRLYARAWWYEQGRINVDNKNFNTTLWAFQMKNLHGWAEKSESLVTDTGEPKDLKEAKAQLEKAFPGIARLLDPDMTYAEELEKTSGTH